MFKIYAVPLPPLLLKETLFLLHCQRKNKWIILISKLPHFLSLPCRTAQ